MEQRHQITPHLRNCKLWVHGQLKLIKEHDSAVLNGGVDADHALWRKHERYVGYSFQFQLRTSLYFLSGNFYLLLSPPLQLSLLLTAYRQCHELDAYIFFSRIKLDAQLIEAKSFLFPYMFLFSPEPVLAGHSRLSTGSVLPLVQLRKPAKA